MSLHHYLEGKLFLDIETAPNLSWTWGMWEQNVLDFKSQWYIMCFSAELDGKLITKGLPDYPNYKPGSEDDRVLVQELWDLLDKARVVIAQNGDQFDLKKINTRFAYYGLPPPNPYRTIDTLKIAKKYFSFNSNSLDNLGEYLGLGRKIKHDGFELWKGCMSGDPKSWRKMKAYNKQDLILLKKVYLHFLPWIQGHPNLYPDKLACPRCGCEEFMKGGFYSNQTTKYLVWRCKRCRGQVRTTENLQIVRPLVSI